MDDLSYKEKSIEWVIVEYVMDCGCRHPREKLINIEYGSPYALNSSPSGLRCPDHPESKIKHIYRECIGCPAMIKVNPKAPTTMRCEDCRKKYKKISRKRSFRNKATTKQASKNIIAMESTKKGDCIFRSGCLTQMIKAGKNSIPCHCCTKYLSLQDFATKGVDNNLILKEIYI